MMMTTRISYEHVDHALAVGDIYFNLMPQRWSYEPKEKFEYGGKKLVWAPDCIFAHGGTLYCAEVQRKALSREEWRKKWSIFNMYFDSAYNEAEYQEWSSKPGKVPQFIAITTQKHAAEGFAISKRELIVIKDITELKI